MSHLFKLSKRDVRSLLVVGFLLVALPLSIFLSQKMQIFEPKATETLVDTNISYDINVLVIKYFPLNGENIDIRVTGDVGEKYATIRQRTIDATDGLRVSLENATKYLGYRDTDAQPALRYHIINTKEYKQAVPTQFDYSWPVGYQTTNKPDLYKILQYQGICKLVDKQNLKEVWIWAYQGPRPSLAIFESQLVNSNGFGGFSNGPYYEAPICSKTYRVYMFNYARGTSEALESWGHQMELELDQVDRSLFRDKFQGNPYPLKNGVTGRCGSVHNPPNSTGEYDRGNSTPNKSDCLDWNPDGMGTLSDISCENWGCDGDPSLYYQIWNWQNLPGRGNQKYYQGNKLRNWWDVHGDYDNVLANSRWLVVTAPSPMPSPLPPFSPSPAPVSPAPTEAPSPEPMPPPPVDGVIGDIDYDGDVDIFDYNILVSHFGPRMPEGGSPADLENDGDVDIYDYNILVINFGNARRG